MSVKKEIINRKGPRKVEEISSEVLELLNRGELETVNLTEWLGVDQITLISHIFPQLGLSELVEVAKEKIENLKKPTAMNIIQEVGKLTYEYAVTNNKYVITFEKLAMHQSDTIRCYATYLAGLNSQWSIEQKLDGALNLIADKHFGVREVVWMALRPSIDVHLSKAIETLSTWTTNTDENIRRFITESTRPRGVWCKHIESLKEKPEQALPILAPLKSDTSVYVQNSVGNWLNDASKSQPDFVIELCERWKNESPTKDTLKIIKRARRTIDKK